MKDSIDKRNDKDKIKSSVIKRANVHYVTREELEKLQADEKEKEAQEIYERLQAEARADEAVKEMEKQKALKEREQIDRVFNMATNSPSGTYGTKSMEQVTKEQIDAILSEKNHALEQVIEDVRKEK